MAPRRSALVTLAAILMSLLTIAAASGRSQEGSTVPHLATVNGDMIYLASTDRGALLNFYCFPSPYGPTVPPEYRTPPEDAQTHLGISLHGHWEQHLPENLSEPVEAPGAEAPVDVTMRFGDGPTEVIRWTLRAQRASLGGFSLGIRNVDAERVLRGMLQASTLTLTLPTADGEELAKFKLTHFPAAVRRALPCHP